MNETKPRTRDGIGAPLAAAALMFALCGGGIAAWIYNAPVAGAVIAQGEIRIEGERKTVQHLEGGIVAEIRVDDGHSVKAGQPLVVLDTSDTRAERDSLVAERDALAARQVRLRAELEENGAPDFSSLESEDPASLATAIESQRALFNARQRERQAELDMLGGTLERLTSRIAALTAEADSIGTQLVLFEQDVDANRKLAERGVIAKAAMRATERDLAALRGQRSSADALLQEAEAAKAEESLKLAEVQTRRVSAISDELSKVMARHAEIGPALAAAKARIDRSIIRAPVSGVVVGLSVVTVGGVVAPGDALMHIVPEEAVLVAETRIQPTDRERLTAEMATEVRLPGLQRRKDVSIDGTVTRISADRMSVEGNDEESDYYAMTVALADIPADVELQPGMPVTAIVATGSRTVLDYVLSPIRDAVTRSMREE